MNLCVCVKRRLVCRIRAGAGCLREGGDNCLKYLQRDWNRKEGRGTLKRGGKPQSLS